LTKKKRYWVMDCRTGKNFICDGWNKKEIADKLGIKSTLLRIEKITYIPEACLQATGGKTLYDVPFEGY